MQGQQEIFFPATTLNLLLDQIGRYFLQSLNLAAVYGKIQNKPILN